MYKAASVKFEEDACPFGSVCVQRPYSCALCLCRRESATPTSFCWWRSPPVMFRQPAFCLGCRPVCPLSSTSSRSIKPPLDLWHRVASAHSSVARQRIPLVAKHLNADGWLHDWRDAHARVGVSHAEADAQGRRAVTTVQVLSMHPKAIKSPWTWPGFSISRGKYRNEKRSRVVHA